MVHLPNQNQKHWISWDGVSLELHSDHGRNYESYLFRDMCHLSENGNSSESDGVVELFNCTLVDGIAKIVAHINETEKSIFPCSFWLIEPLNMTPSKMFVQRCFYLTLYDSKLASVAATRLGKSYYNLMANATAVWLHNPKRIREGMSPNEAQMRLGEAVRTR